MSEENKDDNIASTLKEAVQQVSEEANKEDTPKVETSEEVATDKEVTAEDAPASTEFTPDDALIERAVKAGMSVADAKAFKDAESANRFLTLLEERSAPKEEKPKGGEGQGEDFPAEDFDKAIKELEDDGDYDPKFVNLFKGLAALAKSQAKELSALKAAGATAAAQTTFDKQFAGLDEKVRNHVDAPTKSMLKKKFDFLKAAHASAKDGATDEAVFDEAKKLVLGDIVSKTTEENKAEALEKRKNLSIARPGGESGQRKQSPLSTEEVAASLFEAIIK